MIQNGLEKDEFLFLLDKLGPVVKDLNYRVSFVLQPLKQSDSVGASLQEWVKGDPRQNLCGLSDELVLPREPRLPVLFVHDRCWRYTKCRKFV